MLRRLEATFRANRRTRWIEVLKILAKVDVFGISMYWNIAKNLAVQVFSCHREDFTRDTFVRGETSIIEGSR